MSLREERISYAMLNWQAVLKGILLALVITFLGCAISGLFYHLTMLSEKTLPFTATVLFYASVFWGSTFAARDAGNKGLMHGLTVAISFIILSIIIAKIFLQMDISSQMLLQKGFISMLTGAVGGITGVSLSR